jgi:hypothetical protein
VKLYVYDTNGEKKYLDKKAFTKNDLKDIIGKKEFYMNNELFYIDDVKAETDSESAAPSMVIGGALGLMGGVPGVIIGGLLGALLGNSADNEEKKLVHRFNESKINE